MEELKDRQERAAQNQALFRTVNERVNRLNRAFDAITSPADWFCECANPACTDLLRISTSEYEAIRAHPARFLVAPGEAHVFVDAEIVIDRLDGYWIVEKMGEAADVAVELDPRMENQG